jgi:hypothetical protein
MTLQSETIFNLYVYSNLDLITQVGTVTHSFQGSDVPSTGNKRFTGNYTVFGWL